MKNLLIILVIVLSSCTHKEVKNPNDRTATIEINSDQELLLNGEQIKLENLGQELNNLKSNSPSEEENFTVYLDLDINAEAATVTAIKQELRKANLLKIEYRND